ncbi:Cof-type HAD-IIB family hydrolase [Lacticaseibacillus brantae]|uniref:HAD superfamily hydrolase n=1 Tax=Lacticaseibacillus brantae DSM 23927 TaxID=1423727 RepID=A0A0R2AVB8_9LACO|nr:Cof-type HAD-IIB family hydrolase [Lacticaseibacillus brantae]KRM71336.1 HAD superfamily hydrolase [Lacticaseibacillus brantae DSM 23927]
MTPYLIALDLDGTTLNQDGQLSPRNINVLRAAQEAGHAVVIATGRPDAISENFYEQIGLTSPLINFNGALIHKPHQYWPGERALTLPVTTALALQQLKTTLPISLMVAEGKQLLLADHPYTDMPFLADQPAPTQLFDAQGLTQAPISVTMFIDEAQLPVLTDAVATDFPQLEAKTWGAWSGEYAALEVTAGNASKSNALAYVGQQLGFEPAQMVAFGDDLNDADMLKFAGRGVAMANAKPEILALADDVTTETNAEDGVGRYLERFLKL